MAQKIANLHAIPDDTFKDFEEGGEGDETEDETEDETDDETDDLNYGCGKN